MIGNRALACWLGWLGLSLCGSTAPAADWPQWGGSDGKNMVSEEKGLPDSFVPGEKDPQGAGIKMETTKNVKWVARLGGLTCSTPTVAGGKVFIGTMRDEQGAFLCLDEKTGKTLWQWVAPARQVPATMDGRRFEFGRFPKQLGICSTAAVDGDRVYIVTQRLEVLCLSTSGRPKGSGASASAANPPQGAAEKTPADPPAKGKGEKAPGEKVPWPEPEREADVVWMFDIWDLGVRPSDACDCSVVVRGDFVYALTANGTDRQAELAAHDEFRKCPAPTAPNLIVLDKKTGRLVAVDDVLIAPRMLHGQWSSPSLGQVGGKTLVFFGGGNGICYAFEAPPSGGDMPTLGGEGGMPTPPLRGHVPAEGQNMPGERRAGDMPVFLKKVWSCDCDPAEYKACGGMDMILHYCLGDRRRSDSLNKAGDGTFVGMSEIIATPVFHKGRVYVAIGRDPEHGRGRGALWCIDPSKTGDITETGKVWCYQGLDRTLSTVSIADGLLYVSDVAGRLHCLDAETGKVHWVHETNSKVWGSTLVADGKIYMPTDRGLFVLAAGKEAKPLGKINLGAPMWASPVAANGILYVASTRYLWAVQAKGE
jgi:outer membrane protein assembly factor BamB